jgi:phosphoglycolate phosphatase-like HAD superfamily hydrolase
LIERLRDLQRRPARAAIFDFDGTVALVRAGWMPLMLDMMMEVLAPLSSDAARERARATGYVARLTGRDTIHQMEAFAEHVSELGGTPLPPLEYKGEFARRISHERNARLDAVRTGVRSADSLLVPGTRPLLELLRAQGIAIFLASGTAHDTVVAESDLLGITEFFDEIHGSSPQRFNKRSLLEHLTSGLDAAQILMFGDGTCEIEEAHRIGSVAIGVATHEPECLAIDAEKRGWLIAAGADYMLPNFLEPDLPALIAGRI